jgi:hypothetical protein
MKGATYKLNNVIIVTYQYLLYSGKHPPPFVIQNDEKHLLVLGCSWTA